MLVSQNRAGLKEFMKAYIHISFYINAFVMSAYAPKSAPTDFIPEEIEIISLYVGV